MEVGMETYALPKVLRLTTPIKAKIYFFSVAVLFFYNSA